METAPQYCPVAVATEILADRWTPLILREFIVGAHTFGEVHCGLPAISRTLLSERLKQLVSNGLLERREERPGRPTYWLTAAGKDLHGIIFGLGEWAIRWAYFGDPTDDQLDNTHLMWRFGRGVLHDRLPTRRVVIEFVIAGPGPGSERVWLVIEPGDVDTCVKPPNFDVDLEVRASSRELHRIWMGWTTIAGALRAGTLELDGAPALRRAFPRWFAFSPFRSTVRREMLRTESRQVPVSG